MIDYSFINKQSDLVGKDFETFVFNILSRELSDLGKPPLFVENDNNSNKSNNRMLEGKLHFSYDAIASNGIYDERFTFIEIIVSNKTTFLRKYEKIVQESSGREFNNYYHNDYKFLFVTLLSEEMLADVPTNNNIEVWSFEKLINISRKYPIDYNSFLSLLEYKSSITRSSDKMAFTKAKVEIKDINLHNDLLIKEISKVSKLSLVLGTGVSMPYNDKLSWEKLVDKLYNVLPPENKFDNPTESFKIIGNDLLLKVQYSINILGKSYPRVLHKILYPYKKSVFRYYHTSLNECVDMVVNHTHKFKKILTYNYDDYLEQLFTELHFGYNVLYLKEDSLNEEFPIYHVHGYLPEDATGSVRREMSQSIILSEDDYYDCYNNSLDWRVSTQLVTFKDDVCLFVGNSINDYNERRLIKSSLQKFKYHYAIMFTKGLGDDDLSKIYSHFQYGLHVNIIWAKTIDEIPELIKKISMHL